MNDEPRRSEWRLALPIANEHKIPRKRGSTIHFDENCAWDFQVPDTSVAYTSRNGGLCSQEAADVRV